MSISLRYERSLFGFDEFEPILQSHHPFVADIDGAALQALRVRLRSMHDRERTLARSKRREVRGKGPARGGSHPGTAEHPLKRKQVIAQALRRVNGEAARREAILAREANVEAAQRALTMRRATNFRSHPDAGTFAKDDTLTALPSRRRRPVVHGARIGSISQANKNAQARRDNRG